MADRDATTLRTAPAESSLSCMLVGSGTMPRECAEVLVGRGHRIVAIVSDDLELADWARAHGWPHLPMGDGSGRGWPLADVDVLFSVANLAVLGRAALEAPRIAAINFHDGPLPSYVGLNTPAWAILRGERAHGVAWHLMRDAVDAGELLATRSFPIDATETALTLNAKCYEAGLESFRDVVAALEAGPLVPVPQSDGPRNVFGRADRPSAGGVIDPRLPARELDALVRALEYGPYPNPLGRPALLANGATVLVGRVASATAQGDAPVGTVLAVGDALRVRTGDGDALLGAFETLVGAPLTAREAAGALGIDVGDVVPSPDPQLLRDFGRAARRWLRNEDAWAGRLRDAAPIVAEHFGPNHPDHGPARSEAVVLEVDATLVASLGERPGDALLATVALLFARLEPEHAGDVAFRHGGWTTVVGAAAERFASHVPLFIDVPGDGDAASYRDAFLRRLDDTVAMGSYLRDLPRRRPALRGLDVGVTSPRWRVAFERVARLDDAHRAADAGPWPLTVVVPDDARHVGWRFDSAIVRRDSVERLHRRLRSLLSDLADGVPPHAASILAPEDAADLLAWNRTHAPVPTYANVHDAIDAQARRSPNAPALTAGRVTLDYRELAARAARLASVLARHGAGRGTRVGLMSARGIDMVIALLGILKAGAAYVPLDPDFPADRLAFMIDDAELALVLVDRAHAAALDGRSEHVLVLDDLVLDGSSEGRPDVGEGGVSGEDLAYVIYTSGSTGRPKGVMLEHRNVLAFMTAMDERLEPDDPPGTWLAVTSISFDISVLELFWTLARGFHVVLYTGDDRRAPSTPGAAPTDEAAPHDAMALSLFYFSSDEGEDPAAKYRLLLEGARFADEHGFHAVWTPERHFHAFGGLYPNPAVTGAAVAAVTRNVRIRAGSCVLPLHHPIRVAEDWAVVDNLSGGRVDVSFATGWQPNDFVLAPGAHADRHARMYDGIETVRALWRGETISFAGPDGAPVPVATLPRPVQPELPVWVTAAGNPATFAKAGEIGAHVLTHMLGQDLDDLRDKIRVYREAWIANGHPGHGHVSLMLHTFLGEDRERVRATVREPLRNYLRSSAGLIKRFASSFPAFRGTDAATREALDERFASLDDTDMDALLDHAFDRYFDTSGLFGTVDDGLETVRAVHGANVDEIACLIDFGVPTDAVLAGLEPLAQLREAIERGERPARTIPDLIERHGVSHLQCTPSMAQMLLAEPRGRNALGSLRTMLVGGEALPRALASTLVDLVDGPVHNMYGPTETTVWSTVHTLNGDASSAGDPIVSIGTPIANTQVFVCDPAQRPLPPGSVGELVIGGAGVSRGYWRRPDVTDERFVRYDWSERLGAAPGARLYRTGDLARWTGDGTLAYLGRLDFQVKVRGHRIELGEIEAVLDQHPHVAQSVVATRTGAAGDARLVAWLVPVAGARPAQADLKAFLATRLPEVMVPARVVLLDAFPLTPNKKVDRRALTEPAEDPSEPAREILAPRTALESTLADIWRHVLSVETVGVDDDFFDLGGNSLLAVFVTSEIAKHGYQVGLGQLLRTPTVRGLASHLDGSAGVPGAAGSSRDARYDAS